MGMDGDTGAAAGSGRDTQPAVAMFAACAGSIAADACHNGCQGPDAAARRWCADCERAICSLCVVAHARRAATRQHMLTEIPTAERVTAAAPDSHPSVSPLRPSELAQPAAEQQVVRARDVQASCDGDVRDGNARQDAGRDANARAAGMAARAGAAESGEEDVAGENCTDGEEGSVAWYIAKENDTPGTIAMRFRVSAEQIVELNRARFPGLTVSSTLRENAHINIKRRTGAGATGMHPHGSGTQRKTGFDGSSARRSRAESVGQAVGSRRYLSGLCWRCGQGHINLEGHWTNPRNDCHAPPPSRETGAGGGDKTGHVCKRSITKAGKGISDVAGTDKGREAHDDEAQVDLAERRSYLKQGLNKLFKGHGWFEGRVEEYDAERDVYKIVYVDDDEEELTYEEMKALVLKCQKGAKKMEAKSAATSCRGGNGGKIARGGGADGSMSRLDAVFSVLREVRRPLDHVAVTKFLLDKGLATFSGKGRPEDSIKALLCKVSRQRPHVGLQRAGPNTYALKEWGISQAGGQDARQGGGTADQSRRLTARDMGGQGQWYVAAENDTPRRIAAKLASCRAESWTMSDTLSAEDIVALNRSQYPMLTVSSKLLANTRIFLGFGSHAGEAASGQGAAQTAEAALGEGKAVRAEQAVPADHVSELSPEPEHINIEDFDYDDEDDDDREPDQAKTASQLYHGTYAVAPADQAAAPRGSRQKQRPLVRLVGQKEVMANRELWRDQHGAVPYRVRGSLETSALALPEQELRTECVRADAERASEQHGPQEMRSSGAQHTLCLNKDRADVAGSDKELEVHDDEAQVDLAERRSYLKQGLNKLFKGHGWFEGRVEEYDAERDVYKIVYVDDDEEELTYEEMKALVLKCKKSKKGGAGECVGAEDCSVGQKRVTPEPGSSAAVQSTVDDTRKPQRKYAKPNCGPGMVEERGNEVGEKTTQGEDYAGQWGERLNGSDVQLVNMILGATRPR